MQGNFELDNFIPSKTSAKVKFHCQLNFVFKKSQHKKICKLDLFSAKTQPQPKLYLSINFICQGQNSPEGKSHLKVNLCKS